MRKQHIKRFLETKAMRGTGFSRHPVRFSLPFTVQCTRCRGYAAENTRHNAYKETVKGATYCGVEIYRFIIKCKICHGIYTLTSDPENRCYQPEDACFRVNNKVEESDSTPSLCEHISKDLQRHEEIKMLKRRATRMVSVDIDLVITAVGSGRTVQEVRRQQLLKSNE